VQAAGQFTSLLPAVSAQLRAEQANHDLPVSAFTPEGTFTYSSPLTRFTLRYLLEVSEESAAEADEAAALEGELLATQLVETRAIRHRPLTVSARLR
jgi:Family of unknown function (DUF6204)